MNDKEFNENEWNRVVLARKMNLRASTGENMWKNGHTCAQN